MPDLFLSYSRDDTLAMNVIRDNLRRLGFNLWIDIEHLKPGTPQWERAVKRAVRDTEGMLVLCSPSAEQSEWVNREIHIARLAGRPVIPVLVAGDDLDAIPAALMGDQYCDMRGRSRPELGFRELVAWLSTHFEFPVPEYVLETSGSVALPAVQVINIHGHVEGHIVAIGYDVEGDVMVAGGDIQIGEQPAPQPDRGEKQNRPRDAWAAMSIPDDTELDDTPEIAKETTHRAWATMSIPEPIEEQPVKAPPPEAQPPAASKKPHSQAVKPKPKTWRRWSAIIVLAIVGLTCLIILVTNLIPEPKSTPTATRHPTTVAIATTEMPDTKTPEPFTLTPTNTPTERPTAAPIEEIPDAIAVALAGITNNADWVPISEEKSGAKMSLVPTGCFEMGDTIYDDEKPIHKVCFEEPFWIDVYEVTNAEFAAFLNSEGNQIEEGETWLDAGATRAQINRVDDIWSVDSGYENYPAIEITWYGAAAYCRWRGGRLPTETEWEYTARGPDNLVFPWGNEFNCSQGNFDDEVVVDSLTVAGGIGCDGYDQTAPVGSFTGGVSWTGVYDMSGNVEEWIYDWYNNTYYVTLYAGMVNPQGPETGYFRVLRGGAWNSLYVRAADRSWGVPTVSLMSRGFRCALSYSP